MADLHAHTLTVRDHRISCGSPVLVQHGMGHDAIAPDCFVPTGLYSAEPTELVTAGKNLADIDDIVDNTVNNAYYDPIAFSCPMLPPGTYIVSADVKSTLEPFGLDVTVGDDSPRMQLTGTGAVKHNGRVSFSFTLDPRCTQYKNLYFRFCRYDSPKTYTYSAKNIQLELGSTATPYEPPNIITTHLPEVELRSLPDGTADELVIGADGTCMVEKNVTEYEVQGTEVISVGEHSNGQKYASVGSIASSSSSLLSDRYSCGEYNTIDKYAYIPNARDLVINDNRFTDNDTAKSILASEKPRFVFVTNQTTEPQSPVTLPTLPAPTFNAYHDSQVPSDTSVDYERDVNIAYAELEAKIAALSVAQATS